MCWLFEIFLSQHINLRFFLLSTTNLELETEDMKSHVHCFFTNNKYTCNVFFFSMLIQRNCMWFDNEHVHCGSYHLNRSSLSFVEAHSKRKPFSREPTFIY